MMSSHKGHQHPKHPSDSLNIDQLYELTQQEFRKCNQRLRTQSQQKGGGQEIPNVKELYTNIKAYMNVHSIDTITSQTMIPYGNVLSALNLPNDISIFKQLYPQLITYWHTHKIRIPPTFETVIPIGLVLADSDLNHINNI